jgi:hypothetical protein
VALLLLEVKHKVLQKIEYVCKSISLDDQGYLPHPRGEDLIRQLYACDRLQYGIQHLDACISHWQLSSASPEEKKENLHTKNYKAKLERLRSVRLAHRDQAVRLLDMQKLQVINDT